MAESDFPRPYIIGYGSSPSRCVPELFVAPGQTWDLPVPEQRASTHAQVLRPRRVVWRLAFTRPHVLPSEFATASAPGIRIFARLNGWPVCSLYRRFATALTGGCARLEVDVVSYSFIVSDLHRLLVAGLPAHCERFWTLPATQQGASARASYLRLDEETQRYPSPVIPRPASYNPTSGRL